MDFRVAVADRHHDSPRLNLHDLYQTAVELGGIEEDVRVAGMVQRPSQKGFHLLIDAQRPYQAVDFAGGDTTGVGLYHHCIEGLINPAQRLEPDGEEALLLRSLGMARLRSPTSVVSTRWR